MKRSGDTNGTTDENHKRAKVEPTSNGASQSPKKSAADGVIVFWFRVDLRLADNTALHEASKVSAASGRPLVALFVTSLGEWQEHDLSPAKVWFMMRSLELLKKDLEALNIPLCVRTAETRHDVPGVVVDFANQTGAVQVFCNREYEKPALYAEIPRPSQSPDVPESVKSTIAKLNQPIPEEFPTHRVPENVLKNIKELFPPGEAEALKRLEKFAETKKMNHYKTDRDIPGKDGTSRLSPYLAVGLVSARQCLRKALEMNSNKFDYGNEGIVTWISELCWRDFYRNILVEFPRVCKNRPFLSWTESIPWDPDEEKFRAWCEGKTGYPIVDAGMRQLAEIGWMHNRLRMIVATFLVKDLGIDWRRGEKWFMNNLIDGDFASNNGGWQWAASTGTDAQPYFRIFNPTSQAERFDPSGNFIRKYVPELKTLDTKSLHDPTGVSPRKLAELGYPKKIVDHKIASNAIKELFKLAQQSSVRAQDDESDPKESEEFLKAMEDEIRKNAGAEVKTDLEFTYLFPDNPFKIVVANEVSEILIGVRNKGKNTHTLFAISGAFTNPKNLSQVVRNITNQRYSLPLEPKQEATVPFRFRAELEAQEIGLVVYIDYFDNEEHPHRAIAFKDLVRIASNDTYFDLQGITLMVGLAAGVYFAFKAMYSSFAPETVVKKTRPNKAAIQEEIEAKKDVLSEEWIPEHLKKGASAPKKKAK
ncbi:hypothetical protein HDU96_007212 [Phlyctochytrium bullatum]|nr:hypothetical protein HDU96_007212 [Phlyctochytrium bullatum]